MNVSQYYKNLIEARDFLLKRLGNFHAEICIVLGTGLGGFVNQLSNVKEIPYSEIPHMPTPSVKGHSGKIVFGHLGKQPLLCLAGRSHAYEGIEMYILTFTARLMALIGIKIYIATNASGGSQKGMHEGCLMIISDHVNFWRCNPLSDLQDTGMFPDRNPHMHHLYSQRLAEQAMQIAKQNGLTLFKGVYASTTGPSYETSLETKTFTNLGCSAFGMSTIPETMTAHALGMEVFGMSLITNLAAGFKDEVLTHSAVNDVANDSGKMFVDFMTKFLPEIKCEEKIYKNVELKSNEMNQLISLPQPRPLFPSSQEMSEMISILSSFVEKNISSFIILDQDHQPLLNSFFIVQELPFSKFSQFPFVFPATRSCKFVLVQESEKQENPKYLFLTGRSSSGFAPEEATCLAEMIISLEIQSVFETIVAGGFSVSQRRVLTLKDYVNASGIIPLQKKYTYQFLSHPLTLKSGNSSYFSYAGPSFPTPCEVDIARKAGADSVGYTSLPMLGALWNSTVPNQVLIDIAWDWKNEETILSPFETIRSSFLNLIRQRPSGLLALTSHNDATSRRQISSSLALPIRQTPYDQVEFAAKFILQKTNNLHPKIAICVDSSFVSSLKLNTENCIKIPFSEIPHLCEVANEIPFASLFVGKHEIYVSGSLYWNQGVSGDQIAFVVRLLKLLGITKILFVGSICDFGAMRSMVVISDHAVCSGRNPLFGENDERWGERFFDVQKIYSGVSDLQKAAQSCSLTLSLARVAHFLGPLYPSNLLKNYLSLGGLIDCATTGFVPEALASHHLKFEKLAALGIVTQNLSSENRFNASTLQEASNIIEALIKIWSE